MPVIGRSFTVSSLAESSLDKLLSGSDTTLQSQQTERFAEVPLPRSLTESPVSPRRRHPASRSHEARASRALVVVDPSQQPPRHSFRVAAPLPQGTAGSSRATRQTSTNQRRAHESAAEMTASADEEDPEDKVSAGRVSLQPCAIPAVAFAAAAGGEDEAGGREGTSVSSFGAQEVRSAPPGIHLQAEGLSYAVSTWHTATKEARG